MLAAAVWCPAGHRRQAGGRAHDRRLGGHRGGRCSGGCCGPWSCLAHHDLHVHQPPVHQARRPDRQRGRDIPLNRISGVDFEIGLIDRLFGCGTLVVTDASEQGRVELRTSRASSRSSCRSPTSCTASPSPAATPMTGPEQPPGEPARLTREDLERAILGESPLYTAAEVAGDDRDRARGGAPALAGARASRSTPARRSPSPRPTPAPWPPCARPSTAGSSTSTPR